MKLQSSIKRPGMRLDRPGSAVACGSSSCSRPYGPRVPASFEDHNRLPGGAWRNYDAGYAESPVWQVRHPVPPVSSPVATPSRRGGGAASRRNGDRPTTARPETQFANPIPDPRRGISVPARSAGKRYRNPRASSELMTLLAT